MIFGRDVALLSSICCILVLHFPELKSKKSCFCSYSFQLTSESWYCGSSNFCTIHQCPLAGCKVVKMAARMLRFHQLSIS